MAYDLDASPEVVFLEEGPDFFGNATAVFRLEADLREYAAVSFPPGRPLGEAAFDLMKRSMSAVTWRPTRPWARRSSWAPTPPMPGSRFSSPDPAG